MIEILETEQLIVDQVIYHSPKTEPSDQEAVESLAGTVFIVKDGREFTKLLETILESLLDQYRFYSIFVENFPQYKGKLRSYRGLLPGLGKKLSDSVFSEKEFDLPDNESLFAGLLEVDRNHLSLFIHELLDTRFAFGLLLKPGVNHPVAHPQEFILSLFPDTIEIGKVVYVDLLKSLARYCRPGTLLFDIRKDGQDRAHLGFYGTHGELAGTVNPLLSRLQQNFYIRRRRKGFNYERPEEAAEGNGETSQ